MDVLHPVLRNGKTYVRYIVVGQFYHKLKKRTCLCVFRNDEPFFEHLDGFWDYEEQKVYIGLKFIEHHPTPSRMNPIQRECFMTHWMYRFVDEGIYLRDRDGNPLYTYEPKKPNQTSMEL